MKNIAGGKREARGPWKDGLKEEPRQGRKVRWLSPLPGLWVLLAKPGAARFALAPGYLLWPLRGRGIQVYPQNLHFV
jgi:hypothetical protein